MTNILQKECFCYFITSSTSLWRNHFNHNIETFTQKPIERNASTDVSTARIKWDKVDKDLYSAMVSKGLEDSSIPTSMCTAREIDSSITSINAVLTSAAILCGGGKKKVTHSKKRRKNRMWNDDIKRATVENKHAHWQYKKHQKDGTLTSEIINTRKLAKQNLRRLYRQEIATKRTDDKREIMCARKEDSKLFHKLIRRKRGVSDSKISELEVQGNTYKGKDILTGWKTHFPNQLLQHQLITLITTQTTWITYSKT